jgi:hypothetical protein
VTRAGYRIRISIALALLLASAVLTYRLDIDMQANRQRRIDLAEVRDIRYGLLNANLWAERIAPILAKKIESLDLTANKDVLRPTIERTVDRMIVQAGGIIRAQIANNKSLGVFGAQFGAQITKFLAPLLNVDSLRARVPQFTNTILTELAKPEAKRAIQQSLKNALLSSPTISAAIDMSLHDSILKKYGCTDGAACQALLSKTIDEEESRISRTAIAILAMAAVAFGLILIRRSPVQRSETVVLTLFCAVLLWAGLRNPMIDIDARITRLSFELSGEPIEFTDQVLFFQSKSILDVVRLLLEQGKLGMVAVGLMVLAFSVIFPMAKLVASALCCYRVRGLEANRLVQFFAMKSGKWSMADVFVVALFMAYIGFDGVISSQLDDLRAAAAGFDVLTTNHTALQAGFYLFLGFCIAGMLLGTALSRGHNEAR